MLESLKHYNNNAHKKSFRIDVIQKVMIVNNQKVVNCSTWNVSPKCYIALYLKKIVLVDGRTRRKPSLKQQPLGESALQDRHRNEAKEVH